VPLGKRPTLDLGSRSGTWGRAFLTTGPQIYNESCVTRFARETTPHERRAQPLPRPSSPRRQYLARGESVAVPSSALLDGLADPLAKRKRLVAPALERF
jgi:hypothetical protein